MATADVGAFVRDSVNGLDSVNSTDSVRRIPTNIQGAGDDVDTTMRGPGNAESVEEAPTGYWRNTRVEERLPDALSSKLGLSVLSTAIAVTAIALLFAAVIVSIIVLVIVGAAAGAATGNLELARTIGTFVWVVLLLSYLTWIPIVWGVVRFFDLPLDVSVPDASSVAWGLAAFLVVTGLSVGSHFVFSNAGLTQAQGLTGDSVGPAVVVGLGLALVVGAVVEEFLFRGTIQGLLRSEFSAPAAIVGANVLFVPVHVLNNLGQPLVVAAVNLTIVALLGFVVGALYERHRNVVVPAVVHAAYNASVVGAALLLA